MIVMPSNNSGLHCGYLAGKYHGFLAHLYSPGGQRGPYAFMPYALDNGRFVAWAKNKPWDEPAYIRLLTWARLSGHRPLWAIVPDVVADAKATLYEWDKWHGVVSAYGFSLAFAAQDGHSPSDVPSNADIVFIGGSTDWKHKHIMRFCDSFERVHVGRINTLKWLRYCYHAGVESCDGTGWFRGDREQLRGLDIFLEEMAHGQNQRVLFPGRVSGRKHSAATV